MSVIEVSKLKRFNASDVDDIEAMVKRDLVPHDHLVERFKLAVDVIAYDARSEDLPRYVERLNQVERDILAVPESVIDSEMKTADITVGRILSSGADRDRTDDL